jgi:ketosteroid isomerase-like protein
LAKNFVMRQMPVAGNLRATKAGEDASGDLGYQAGTWSLTITMPDQAPFEATGNYNFVCKKVADGSWKFSVLTLEDHDPVSKEAK